MCRKVFVFLTQKVCSLMKETTHYIKEKTVKVYLYLLVLFLKSFHQDLKYTKSIIHVIAYLKAIGQYLLNINP